MNKRSKTAGILYIVVAAVSLILGVIYLMSTSFMPYHADAIDKSWESLEGSTQYLFLALMDVAGAGWLTLSFTILLLYYFPFRKEAVWVRYAIPSIILIFYIPTLLATLSVLFNTAATPPWSGNAICCLLALFGLILDAPWKKG
ncbi:hypothetical protein J8281_16505 [Aquimarina sp. U1-2]|uniref:hypothetical protein n=1 Tax=Aquimarina sp. U1-2 TaxID=2823141 RepID=UPI001AEC8E43|nr:hypothetical protein [Aquimarina sp. U1-2]MBP2833799.1 hypothetical protein [Aquimarina sp. U1-2]